MSSIDLNMPIFDSPKSGKFLNQIHNRCIHGKIFRGSSPRNDHTVIFTCFNVVKCCIEGEVMASCFSISLQQGDILHLSHAPKVQICPNDSDKPYLSSRPGGVWWNNDKIVILVGESITTNYRDFTPNWTSTPQSVRDQMFNWFKDRVRYDDEVELRKGYEKYAKRRLANYVYRAGKKKKKPTWMPVLCFEKLKKRREEDEKFKEVSKKATENRLKGGVDGKAPATHVLGRKSASRALDSVGDPNAVTPFKLLEM